MAYLTAEKKAEIVSKWHGSLPSASISMLVEEIAAAIAADVAADNETAAAVADLNQDVSEAYVEAEVQAISDKVDEILGALRTAGLMATE